MCMMSRLPLTLENLLKFPLQPLPFSSHTFPKLGIKVSYLNEFIEYCGGRDILLNFTTTDICEKFIKPMTSRTQSSYCELLYYISHYAVNNAQIFISHAWNYKFLDVCDALSSYFQKMNNLDVFIWFDIFSNNQHKAIELDFDYWSRIFQQAIQEFHSTVMVLEPWNDPIPLTRAWCLWELYCTFITNSQFNIAMTPKSHQKFLSDIVHNPTMAMNKMLGTINVERSQCSQQSDLERIFYVINSTNNVGFSKLNSLIFSHLRDWILQTLEMEIASASNSTNSKYLHALAILYSNQGQYSQALSLYLQCLSLRKLKYGLAHPMTIKVMCNLALLYERQGDYSLAESLSIECLELSRKVMGNKDLNTITSMNNLAHLYAKQSNYQLAESLYLECLKLRNEVLGEHHPDTFTTINNLAGLYECQFKYYEAKVYYEKCLLMSQQYYGERHPITLTYLSNIAHFYIKQHHHATTTSSTTTTTSGSSASPLTSTSTSSTGASPGTSASTGSIIRNENEILAERYCLNCLNIRKEVLGENHPETLNSLHLYAYLLRLQGSYQEAKVYYEDVYHRRKDILGDKHPDTLTAHHNLAEIYLHIDEIQAMILFEECFLLKMEVFGGNNSSTLSTMKSLIQLYERRRDQEDLLLKSIPLRLHLIHHYQGTSSSKETTYSTFKEMKELAAIYSRLKMMNEAKESYFKCYQLCPMVYPDHDDPPATPPTGGDGCNAAADHENVVPVCGGSDVSHKLEKFSFYSEFGQFLLEENELKLSRELLEESFQGRKALLGPVHIQTLSTLSLLAKYYNSCQDYSHSLQLYEECVSLCRQEYGNHHIYTFQSIMNLIKFHDTQQHYDVKDIELYLEGLHLCQEFMNHTLSSPLPPLTPPSNHDHSPPQPPAVPPSNDSHHSDMLLCYNCLMECYSECHQYSKAVEYGELALELQRNLSGLLNHDTIIAMNNLATLYELTDQLSSAESMYSESLTLSREVLGDTHPDTLIAIQNLAQFYLNIKNYSIAEALVVECLISCRDIHGPDHIQTKDLTDTLISIYKEQGDDASAAALRRN